MISLDGDKRPKRHGWAPGSYINKCHGGGCEQQFIGDKRAITCADCAYALPDVLPPIDPSTIDWGALSKLGWQIGSGGASLPESGSVPRQIEVTDAMLTAAMRAFEPMSSVLRYREKDKWHSCDMMGMRDAIRAVIAQLDPAPRQPTHDELVARIASLEGTIREASDHLGDWLTDNTEVVFEEQSEIHAARGTSKSLVPTVTIDLFSEAHSVKLSKATANTGELYYV